MEEFWKLVNSGKITRGLFQKFLSDPRSVADVKLEDNLPRTMTIGDRVYEVLSFLQKGENQVDGPVMVKRAKEMSANLGEDDGQYLLKHQQDIPVIFYNVRIFFVFTDWRHPNNSDSVCYIAESDGQFVSDWEWLNGQEKFGRSYIILRRIK